MTKYLFLFTIGPVQSFISQARKTQDLYAGSKLLSDLIKETMSFLKQKDNNTEIIFPAKNIESKPNRFIAIVETDDPNEFGKEIENKVRKKFKELADKIFDNKFGSKNKPSNFDSQISDFLENYWIMLPYDENNYAEQYEKIEKMLGAVKNVRVFKQLGETGRKCSLCGKRNVLFYKKSDNGHRLKYIQEDAIEITDNTLNSGEGLCAVCFVKRLYKDISFPSTAGIATMDWIGKMPKEKQEEYEKSFDNFDEQLYYEENLRKDYLEKYGHFTTDEKLNSAKKLLKKLYELIDQEGTKAGKPSKYYAILMLDGDNMGKWISGEFLKDKSHLRNFHKKLSEELGSFAQNVKNIIKEPKGKLVYAGGDDVLAFVNLNYLLAVMRKLREGFSKFEDLEPEITKGKKSSASVGVAIAHYKTPLSEVLKWARAMEYEAKEKVGRDAFAVAVLKRSGEIRKTGFKWQYDNSSVIEILGCLIKSIQEDFSNTFIKNLGVEFKRLMDEDGKYDEKSIIKTEIKRLVGKSCMMVKKQDETKEDFKKRKKQAIDDLAKKLGMLYDSSKSLDNFLSSLNMIDFIKRGGQLK